MATWPSQSIFVHDYGHHTDVVETVEVLEKKPDSEGARLMFQEEVERAGVDQDPEIREAARLLQDQLESQPGGEQHIQQARGSYIAQADHGSMIKDKTRKRRLRGSVISNCESAGLCTFPLNSPVGRPNPCSCNKPLALSLICVAAFIS